MICGLKRHFTGGGPLDPPHVITYVAEPMWNRVKMRYTTVASLAWVPGFRGTPRFWKEGSGTPQFCEGKSRNYLLLHKKLVIEISKVSVLCPWFSGKVRLHTKFWNPFWEGGGARKILEPLNPNSYRGHWHTPSASGLRGSGHGPESIFVITNACDNFY